jgi:hypothetical protein
LSAHSEGDAIISRSHERDISWRVLQRVPQWLKPSFFVLC